MLPVRGKDNVYNIYVDKPETDHLGRPWRRLEDNVTRPAKYKVVQIWPGLFVCKQVTVCPGHIWTTLYIRKT